MGEGTLDETGQCVQVAKVRSITRRAIRAQREQPITQGLGVGLRVAVMDEQAHPLAMQLCADGRAYATGAVRAAQWLKGRPPGLYSMNDVLGLT